jgi:hypothetical protein
MSETTPTPTPTARTASPGTRSRSLIIHTARETRLARAPAHHALTAATTGAAIPAAGPLCHRNSARNCPPRRRRLSLTIRFGRGASQPLAWAADRAERREGGMGQGRDALPALFPPTFWTVSSVNLSTALVVTPIRTKLFALNFSDDEFNPDELHILQKLMPEVKNGLYVVQQGTSTSFGHLTMAHPELWADHVASFMNWLGDPPTTVETAK